MRDLRVAGVHGCGQTSEFAANALAFIAAQFGHGPVARSGVEAVSYRANPSAPARPAGSRGATFLGAEMPSVAQTALLVLMVFVIAGFTLSVIIADAAGLGPRHPQWRQRMVNRFNSLK